jgi:hypothetical protein
VDSSVCVIGEAPLVLVVFDRAKGNERLGTTGIISVVCCLFSEFRKAMKIAAAISTPQISQLQMRSFFATPQSSY